MAGTSGEVTLTARTQNGAFIETLPVETLASLGSGWEGLTATPQGTRYHGLAYHDGYLYQIGGETALWTPTDAVYRYDVAGDSWSARAPLPVDASGVDAVALGDRIYVPGGSDDTETPFDGGTFLNSLYIYDPGANTWSPGASMPVSLAFASAVALDGKLYVIGGELDNGSYSDALYVYDPDGDSWSQGATMSEARAYAGAGVAGGQIYVAGGYAGEDVTRDSLEIYDPVADTWRAGPDLPTTLASTGSSVVEDRYLILTGGGNMLLGKYNCSRNAWAFDVVTAHWFPLPDLNRCLYGTQVTGDGHDLYMVGGRTNEGGWHTATELERLARCAAVPDAGWSKEVLGVTWTPGLTRTVYAQDVLGVNDAITSTEAFTLVERWNPNHLTLMTYTLTPPGTGLVVPGGAWRVEPAAPFAYMRGDAEYSQATGLVYVLGGRQPDGNDVGRVWAFDPHTGVYTDTGVNMPSAVTNYAIARLINGEGREVFMTFGGYLESVGGFTNLVQGFYPDDQTTAVFAADPLPETFLPGGVAVVDNKAYVFGGTDGSTLLDVTYVFDPTAGDGNRWSIGPTMNQARRYIPSAVVDGVIYALGGAVIGGGGLVSVTTTEKLDTSTGAPAWDEAGVAPMPIACEEAPAFGFDTTVTHTLAGSVVIAGCGHWPEESGLALRYDAVHDRWDLSFPDLNQARRNHAGALVPSAEGVPGMWVWGGRYDNDFNVLSTPEHYVLSELNWIVPAGAGDGVAFNKQLNVAPGLWSETGVEETLWIRGGIYGKRPFTLFNGVKHLVYLPLVLRDFETLATGSQLKPGSLEHRD
jgi:N-acetylneuraminic acid mutarotase